MTMYWLMLLVPMVIGIGQWRGNRNVIKLQWIIYGCFLVLLVGLRHEVGGDWYNYIENYRFVEDSSLSRVLASGFSRDLAYDAVYWFSFHYLNGIYATNLFCALVFVAGLMRLCRRSSTPWMALCVSIPYLVIVVGMGYTRQAVAIGFIMWGLVDLMDGKVLKYYVAVLFGACFHKTALVMLPVGLVYGSRVFSIRVIIFYGILLCGAFFMYSTDWFQSKVYHYVNHPVAESSGAFVRILMNVVAAIVFLYFQHRWRNMYGDERLWRLFAIVSFVLLPLTLVSSTTVDRLGLYLIPFQLMVFGQTLALIKSVFPRTIFIVTVLCGYSGALWVWLNFGSYSVCWLPYRNLLF